MVQQIPNARLVILPQAGHNVHLEQPSAFSRTVLNFWQACDSFSHGP
jgi:pimeloyl-ACP methyl ester carboxylesterase